MSEFVKTVETIDEVEGVEVFTRPTDDFTADNVYSSRLTTEDRIALFTNLLDNIKEGNVKKQLRVVDFKVKEKDTLVKVYRKAYWQCIAVNELGALALPNINGEEKEVWNAVSKYADAGQYQPVYVELRSAAAGPEAAIKKFKKFTAGLSPEQLAAVRAMVNA